MTSSATKLLGIPGVPRKARIAHVFPSMVRSLLSVPVLCDAGCEVKFTKTQGIITLNGKIILQGNRDQSDLWCIPGNTPKNNKNDFPQSLTSSTQPTVQQLTNSTQKSAPSTNPTTPMTAEKLTVPPPTDDKIKKRR